MSHQDQAPGITVAGVGVVDAPPDTMTVDLGISLRAATVAEASAVTAEKTARLIDTLKDGGVAAEDLMTTQYAIHPEYDHHDDQQRFLGYRVTNNLRVVIRDVPAAGSLIDAAVSAGGDDTIVNNVAFSIEDDQAVLDAAREAAWGDALAKGEHLARLSGRTLGAALSIVESAGRPPGPSPMLRMAAMAESTAIEGGATTVSVTLEVRFALE